jgi:hypothetical protein
MVTLMSVHIFLRRMAETCAPPWRTSCLALLAGVLTGCGGSGGAVSADQTVVSTGHVYPAVEGLVFAEYADNGVELQRSGATAADGSFQFTKKLSGTRIEALYSASANTVEPVYSSQLGSAPATSSLEITPLTTWYDQLVAGGESAGTAAEKIKDLFATNCSSLAYRLDTKYLNQSAVIPIADHDWLLGATSAYLQAARNLGVGPKVDFSGWSSALGRHGDSLSQLCAFSAAISTPAWASAQADRLRQEARVQVPDTALLAAAVSGARAHGLENLSKQIQQIEYPDQTTVLQANRNGPGAALMLGSDFVMAQYQLAQEQAKAAPKEVVALPTAAGVAITSAGTLVHTLEASTSASGTAPATMQLVNKSTSDKSVRLVLNGQKMADLPTVIEQIVAMPVAFSGEPLYRRAWRYLMLNKRNTQPLAISFFQFQPDLWLRSVGSSYCEAQSSVLYRIWRAMGYEARVHALTGHVTVEILIDGRWQVFDPYLEVFYTNRQGQIVGVAELEEDRTLITQPQTPLLPPSAAAYSDNVADIFQTADDNYVGYDYMSTEPDPMDSEVQIPAGGYLEFNSRTDVTLDSTETGYQVDMASMKLWIPPGYTGTLRLPLLLQAINGAGSVQLLGRYQDASGALIETRGLAGLGSLDTAATDPDIHARLQWFYFHDRSEVGVTEIRVNSSGPGGLYLTLLVNPKYFSTREQLEVRTYGDDVDGLQFIANSGTR